MPYDPKHPQPKVSIAILTRNGGPLFHQVIDALISQKFDQPFGKIAISCANLAIRRSVWEKLRFGDCETIEDRVMQVKLFENSARMMQVKDALSYHGHDYTWKELSNRIASFSMGFARLGY